MEADYPGMATAPLGGMVKGLLADPLGGIPSGVSDPIDTGGGSLETLEAATSTSADGGAPSAGDDASQAP